MAATPTLNPVKKWKMFQYDERRMELVDHLSELRSRIIRSLWYVVIASIVAYQLFAPLYGMFYRPLEKEMIRQNTKRARESGERAGLVKLPHSAGPPTQQEFNTLVDAYNRLLEQPAIAPYMSITFRNFYEPFTTRLTVSIITGCVFALPAVIWELSLFLLPALTPQERRPLRMLVPLSVCLLILGMSIAYLTMFYAMGWFLSYLADYPAGANLMQNPNDYILFFVKMMGAFSIAFQLPVLLMGLAFLGLITSKGLLKQWRWGLVLSIAAGLFTPSNDIPSMALMTIPLFLLYILSFFLVKYVEKTRPKHA